MIVSGFVIASPCPGLGGFCTLAGRARTTLATPGWLGPRPAIRGTFAASGRGMTSPAATYSAPPKTKILMALTPEKADRMARALAGHDLVFATDRADALRALEQERFGLVIIAVH